LPLLAGFVIADLTIVVYGSLVNSMIQVGISHCLLGAQVRFDGGHKQNRFCRDQLSKFFEFVPLCPEVGIGLPTPRKTLRLVGSHDNPRAVYSDGAEGDFTEALSAFADQHKNQLDKVSGYIFCKASPSCGLERVKVYNDKGMAEKNGVGVFAARVKALYPDLPLEEDGRLNDPLLRDSFIKRVYLYAEWQQMLNQELSVKAVQQYHARHKLLLLAHSQPVYRELGPLVAGINKDNLATKSAFYFSRFMEGMSQVATRKNNTNVLMHLQGFVKNALDSHDRQELAQAILDYREGLQPLMAPLMLLKHHLKRNPDPYVLQQSYLNPYPDDLAIRVVL
jgi:uncharacterized protein YbgA (DUF1722 family)/uncharacterized protein YbbK (DUF523 family)